MKYSGLYVRSLGEKAEREREREMGRPPCCEKVGIKKGPWTPEEDIVLVSYIQEHGPGNWRSVPTNTGNLKVKFSIYFELEIPSPISPFP